MCWKTGGKVRPMARQIGSMVGPGAVRSRARRPCCSTSISLRSARSSTTCCHSGMARWRAASRSISSLRSTRARKVQKMWPRMPASVLWKIGRVASSAFAVLKASSTAKRLR